MSNVLEVSRRGFLGTVGAGALFTGMMPRPVRAAAATTTTGTPQRCCVVMFDGFGRDYYEKSSMPTLKRWEQDGFYKPIRGVMPAVTNTNLSGISCGVHADEHGITGNSYWDADADQEQFMSDGNLLTAATMFQRAGQFGVRSILVSAKQKTISLMKQGTYLAIGSQDPPAEIVARYGKAPEIYSPDVNYWVWKVAIDLIKSEPNVGLFFVHTTDYPMHKYAPESVESQVHLRTIDQFLAEAADTDPGMAFFLLLRIME
jgi:phosphonoacetate hydrolase